MERELVVLKQETNEAGDVGEIGDGLAKGAFMHSTLLGGSIHQSSRFSMCITHVTICYPFLKSICMFDTSTHMDEKFVYYLTCDLIAASCNHHVVTSKFTLCYLI